MRVSNNFSGDIEMEEMYGLLNLKDTDSFKEREQNHNTTDINRNKTKTKSSSCGSTCFHLFVRMILIFLIILGAFILGQYSSTNAGDLGSFLNKLNNFTNDTIGTAKGMVVNNDGLDSVIKEKDTVKKHSEEIIKQIIEENGSDEEQPDSEKIIEPKEKSIEEQPDSEEIIEQKDDGSEQLQQPNPEDIIEQKDEYKDQEPETNDDDVNSIEKWGKWKFYDGGADTRPQEDYCAKYPNRDVPEQEFPMDAWQADAVYVNHFINEGLNLIERVQEAILAEYGHDKKEDMKPEELVTRRKMFELTFLDDDLKMKDEKNAGATTQQSFNGLVRRLLHAMMTNDSFTVVLGGHSAAAGHGNHFKQSYMMQFFYVMEPVFERLGMKLIVRNISQGGLGTMQGALGSKDIYGSEIDVILWDSSMTEKSNPAYELFARQALLQNRAPVLYNGMWDIQKALYENVDADVFYMGNGNAGIPTTVNEEQVLSLPWAARSIICDKQRGDLCNGGYKYRTKCWINRPDVTPPKKQDAHIGSQVGWHPGFRTHQLTGRLLSFVILSALENALSIWSEKTIVSGHPLSDEYWHVTDYYNNIHTKLNSYTNEKDGCESLNKFFPSRICSIPLNGRTEFQPRANPNESSIVSVVKYTSDENRLKYPNELLYDGPDVYIPAIYDLPDGSIDVHAIASARRSKRFLSRERQQRSILQSNIENHAFNYRVLKNSLRRNLEDDAIVPGNWIMDDNIKSGICGGEYNDICGRNKDNSCLLSGHMDTRGGILGDSSTGWLIMDLPNVQKGIVIIKFEDWHGLQHKDEPNGTWFCQKMLFDYAINGKVTTLNKTEFVERWTNPQRVVLLLTLLDDEEFGNSLDGGTLEVALRFRGCLDKETRVLLTHVYWA